MKGTLLIMGILYSTASLADVWKALPTYSMFDLLNQNGGNGLKFESEITGTSGLSWPDGRQAIVTSIEIRSSDSSRFFYRCTDYFDSSMRQTGQMCYELRK
jgi:hypothetical protein